MQLRAERTSLIWGSDKGWAQCKAVIPSFSRSYDVWLGDSTPYRKSYARFAPSLINNEQEIDRALAVLSAL